MRGAGGPAVAAGGEHLLGAGLHAGLAAGSAQVDADEVRRRDQVAADRVGDAGMVIVRSTSGRASRSSKVRVSRVSTMPWMRSDQPPPQRRDPQCGVDPVEVGVRGDERRGAQLGERGAGRDRGGALGQPGAGSVRDGSAGAARRRRRAAARPRPRRARPRRPRPTNRPAGRAARDGPRARLRDLVASACSPANTGPDDQRHRRGDQVDRRERRRGQHRGDAQQPQRATTTTAGRRRVGGQPGGAAASAMTTAMPRAGRVCRRCRKWSSRTRQELRGVPDDRVPDRQERRGTR